MRKQNTYNKSAFGFDFVEACRVFLYLLYIVVQMYVAHGGQNSYFCSPVNSNDTVSVNESFSNVCAILHNA